MKTSHPDELYQIEQLNELSSAQLVVHYWGSSLNPHQSILLEFQGATGPYERVWEYKVGNMDYDKCTMFKTISNGEIPDERLVVLKYYSHDHKIEVITYFIGMYPDEEGYKKELKKDNNNCGTIKLGGAYKSMGQRFEMFATCCNGRLFFSGGLDDQVGSVPFLPLKPNDLTAFTSRKGLCSMKTMYGPNKDSNMESIVLGWNGKSETKVRVINVSKSGEISSSDDIYFPPETKNCDIVTWEGVDGEFNTKLANEWRLRAAVIIDYQLSLYVIKDKKATKYHRSGIRVERAPAKSLQCYNKITPIERLADTELLPKKLQQSITFIDKSLNHDKNQSIKGFTAILRNENPEDKCIDEIRGKGLDITAQTADERSRASTVLGYIYGTPPGNWSENEYSESEGLSNIKIITSINNTKSLNVSNGMDMSGNLGSKSTSLNAGFTTENTNLQKQTIGYGQVTTLSADTLSIQGDHSAHWDVGWVYLVSPIIHAGIYAVKCIKSNSPIDITYNDQKLENLTISYAFSSGFNPPEFIPFKLSNPEKVYNIGYSNFITKGLPAACPTNDLDGWYSLGLSDESNPSKWWDSHSSKLLTLPGDSNDPPKEDFPTSNKVTKSIDFSGLKIKSKQQDLNIGFKVPFFSKKISHKSKTEISYGKGIKIDMTSTPFQLDSQLSNDSNRSEIYSDYTSVWFLIPDEKMNVKAKDLPWCTEYMEEYDATPWCIHYYKYS